MFQLVQCYKQSQIGCQKLVNRAKIFYLMLDIQSKTVSLQRVDRTTYLLQSQASLPIESMMEMNYKVIQKYFYSGFNLKFNFN